MKTNRRQGTELTGLQRTRAFIAGNAVDRPPFHPIIMRWAAKHAGVKYRDFCLDPLAKCGAMIQCADDFGIDWVTVMSDPYAEASAFCSQVGPGLYRHFAWAREQRMIAHIHKLGAIAKLHICGNTEAIMPDMIASGADIIDVDHLVPDMARFVHLLRPGQVFSGKSDPVSIIQNGTPEQIAASVRESLLQTSGRGIVSAGCEITPGTSTANMQAFRTAAGGACV